MIPIRQIDFIDVSCQSIIKGFLKIIEIYYYKRIELKYEG